MAEPKDKTKEEKANSNTAIIQSLEEAPFLGTDRKKGENFEVTAHQAECFIRRKRAKASK